ADYQEALAAHYAKPKAAEPPPNFISFYASSHWWIGRRAHENALVEQYVRVALEGERARSGSWLSWLLVEVEPEQHVRFNLRQRFTRHTDHWRSELDVRRDAQGITRFVLPNRDCATEVVGLRPHVA